MKDRVLKFSTSKIAILTTNDREVFSIHRQLANLEYRDYT